MIVVTGFKWVPPFAQGQVRDHRVRWMLEEVGLPYEVRLIDAVEQKSEAYRLDQPFGQVPTMTEPGRPTLFESGAIVLDLALRTGQLLPADEGMRALCLSWYFAALNSVEPALQALTLVEFFTRDEADRDARRPSARRFAEQRLGELQAGLGERAFAVGDGFTIADLMLASILKIAASLEMTAEYPGLAAYQARHLARPAYAKVYAEQMATYAAHGPRDMRYREAGVG